MLKATLVYLHEILALSVSISHFFALNKPRTFICLIGQCMNKCIFGTSIVSNRTFEVKWILLCYVIASFASLFFLSISSLEQVDLVNVLFYLIWHVWDLFLKFYIRTDYNLQPSSVFYFHLVQPFVFSSLFLSECSIFLTCWPSMYAVDILDPSIVSPCLNCRHCNNLENIKKNMISMYLLVLIRMTRQHEKNMIYLNQWKEGHCPTNMCF